MAVTTPLFPLHGTKTSSRLGSIPGDLNPPQPALGSPASPAARLITDGPHHPAPSPTTATQPRISKFTPPASGRVFYLDYIPKPISFVISAPHVSECAHAWFEQRNGWQLPFVPNIPGMQLRLFPDECNGSRRWLGWWRGGMGTRGLSV